MTTIPTVDYALQAKLWSHMRIQDPRHFYKSCWLFEGAKTQFGHGHIRHRGHTYGAHRVAYMLAHNLKELHEDIVIRHKCDCPMCINPLHLETGSQIDNNLDMWSRGRNPKGVLHGNALFDDVVKIREIRWLFQEAGLRHGTFSALAERYGVSNVVIAHICHRRTWNEVPDDFDTLIKPAPLAEKEIYTRTENHGGSVVTPADVQRMRAMRGLGASLKFLSEKFNLHGLAAASNICARKTWTDVPDAAPEDVLTPEEIAEAKADAPNTARGGVAHPQARVTEIQVRQLRWLWSQIAAGVYPKYRSIDRMARQFQITKPMVEQICHRRTWQAVVDDFDNLEKVDLV